MKVKPAHALCLRPGAFISFRQISIDLKPAELSIDATANLGHANTLFHHLGRLERLVLADITIGGMVIGVARKQ